MNASLHPPLAPKHGRTLRVVSVARISTDNQDERSLGDQEALLRQFIEANYDGPVDWIAIASRGSGEHLDRSELHQLEELIDQDRLDLVIAEDLARICRRKRAYDFCELCLDHNVRLIALNDRVDTAQEGWEDSAFISTWHHERSNRDTSGRIRRSQRNRFANGGMLMGLIYGIVKPEGAKHDSELRKDPTAERVYDEWFRRLEDGATFSEIADWLNEQGIPTGPKARTDKWTCKMVSRITRNPLLKGVRVRNRKKSRRIHQTGRRRSVPAEPGELLQRECPHLAFVESARYDRVIRLLRTRNAKYRRKKVNGVDPRQGVPKKRTVWPGQHIYCGICGRMFVYGGHGQRDRLVCTGARDYHCWNATTVDGPTARERLSEAILSTIESLPDFDAEFCELVSREANEAETARQQGLVESDRRRQEVDRKIRNVLHAIEQGQTSASLTERIKELEQEKEEIRLEQDELHRQQNQPIALPSIDAVKLAARRAMAGLLARSPECTRLIRRLIPKLLVYPFRLCDGGPIVLRARFVLDLVPLLPGTEALENRSTILSQELTVDLFDSIPERAAFRELVVAKRSEGKREREVAAELGITVTAAQRAAALQRRMERLGLTDPYVPVNAMPADYNRIRRHNHPRYRFEPLPEEVAD